MFFNEKKPLGVKLIRRKVVNSESVEDYTVKLDEWDLSHAKGEGIGDYRGRQKLQGGFCGIVDIGTLIKFKDDIEDNMAKGRGE